MSHVDVGNTTDRSPQCLAVSVGRRERKTDLHRFRVDDDNYYSPLPDSAIRPRTRDTAGTDNEEEELATQ